MNKFLAGTVLGLATVAASANPIKELMENTYGGFAMGPSRYPGFCDGGHIDCENTGNAGWKYYGGFRMSPSLSGEIGYLNFERGAVTYAGPTVWQQPRKTIRADGWNFNFAFRRELTTNWSVVGRVGIARMKAEYYSHDGLGNSTLVAQPKVRTTPYLGAALALDVSQMLGSFAPWPLDRFTVEMAVDTVRVQSGDYKRWARMWTIGGGLEF